MSKQVRVAHIITGLNVGGAEVMLYQLLSHLEASEGAVVISLLSGGTLAPELRALGIPVHELGVRSWMDIPGGILAARRVLAEFSTDVIQGWMTHANFVASVAALFLRPRPAVSWGIHYTHYDPQASQFLSGVLTTLLRPLSRVSADQIVCCSRTAFDARRREGYPISVLRFIPNGFDTSRFKPNREDRLRIRKELGLPDGAFVVGIVANDTPAKDYRTLLSATRLATREAPDIRVVACGSGVDLNNARIADWVASLGVESSVTLLGQRRDVPRLMNAFDLFTTSSRAEAFPLVVGEAMASAVPCVVTDVGDSAALVGTAGAVVPPQDPSALADAWLRIRRLSPEDRLALGQQARQRVIDLYDVRSIARVYAASYRSLMKRSPDGNV